MNARQASDWLNHATARFVYHFGEGRDANGNFTGWADRPAGACGIVREIHFQAPGGANSSLQVALECSDGTGNVLMKKVQAESALGQTALRWIINGLTVLNNKGKPVKQYEPAFSDIGFGCELPPAKGVTPIIYYDAAGRVVRTEMPDGTFSRVEFSPWHVKSFDANDTINEPNNVWYAQRTAVGASVEDKRAAKLSLPHQDTPALTILDNLGREVIAIAHNRVEDANGSRQIDGKNYRDERYLTFTKLDAEGKPLWIRDARGNLVMQYITPAKANNDPSNAMPANAVPCYDIAGNLLYQRSMDAGDRWMLMDAAGKPMLAWDTNQTPDVAPTSSENRLYLTEYDGLHRPIRQWLSMNGGSRKMVERFEYADTTGNSNITAHKAANLVGQLVKQYDPSGLVETVRLDFSGNVLEVQRRLNKQPRESLIDWQTNPNSFLETEIFTQNTEYDALKRMTRLYNWHRLATPEKRVAVYEPRYNERGALVSEDMIIRAKKTASGRDPASGTRTHAIQEIRYNAKGQKELLKLGNGTITQYDYDPRTFRLRQLRTTRPTYARPFPQYRSDLKDPKVLQQLLYTYDPVGNITEISDEAYKPAFFQNALIETHSLYEYDALYRLIEASGRENGAAIGAPQQIEGAAEIVSFPVTAANVLRKYQQDYQYDSVGNIKKMHHSAGLGTWTRTYQYALDSNRLTGTDTDNPSKAITYRYDTHGNMLNLANVPDEYRMQWDHRDMIRSINLGGGGTAYYQYDASKQRTRKRIENQNGLGGYWERIYLAGYELYRRYNAANPATPVEEIESLHLLEGEQRVLLIDDMIKTNRTHANGTPFRTGPTSRYQYSNHLGSACLELDDKADIISYEEYHPYGTSAYRAMKSGIEALQKRYRYTGIERDEESGLNYHGARSYAAWLGRWTSSDPVPQTNLYAYALNSPTRFVDLDGREEKELMLQVVARALPYAGAAATSAFQAYQYYFPLATAPTAAPVAAATGTGSTAAVGTGLGLGALALGTGLLLLLAGMLGAGAYGASWIGEAQQSPGFKESIKYYANASAKSQEKIKEDQYQPPPSTSPEETAKRELLRKTLSGEKDVAKFPGVKGEAVSDPSDRGKEPVSDPSDKGEPVSAPGETGEAVSDPALTGTTGSVQLAPTVTVDDFVRGGGKIRVIKIPPEKHHIASNKDLRYTPLFKKLFEGAGISLEDQRNKVSIEGHEGPHGAAYNQPILDALTKAVKGLTPGSTTYKVAFENALAALKKEVARAGSDLNDLVTRW